MDLATKMVTSSQNIRARLEVSSASASVLLAASRVSQAKKVIDKGMGLAAKPGNIPYLFDLRLVACEAAAKPDPSPASRACMEALEKDATAEGFLLIGRKARAAASSTH